MLSYAYASVLSQGIYPQKISFTFLWWWGGVVVGGNGFKAKLSQNCSVWALAWAWAWQKASQMETDDPQFWEDLLFYLPDKAERS